MPTVLLLPDSALLVPGAAGSQADPLAGARAAVLAELREAGRGAVLVIAPGRVTRVLTGPFGDGLAAAGIARVPAGSAAGMAAPTAPPAGATAPGVVPAVGAMPPGVVPAVGATPPGLVPAVGAAPGVGAAAALALLALAGHDPDRAATVLETGSEPGPVLPVVPAAPPELVLVVGSLSARHGPDAPLPDDPEAIAADVALLTALAAGPRALATVLGDLPPAECDRLAITGGRPWHCMLSLLAGAGNAPGAGAEGLPDAGAEGLPDADAALLWSGTPGGAQHAVARWRIGAAA
ncbi:hypothetical protein [Cellulomonas denverensis]|uniref:Uncharacterized protein n=1 Tax=Cellulomonas denverensis TaxID=264297 RepID=A0A7X6R052_9CELL|nr:hypothetical protein [Cellulomonas denverensis]NKY23812.1 hypothetical protein [Cellulomonas denverensis]GIG25180.1 hypothetical protein Cde04nite_14240 [Cellulomonas denverensis]